MRLVLASTSPARLATLRAAGIEPLTVSPGVDEEAAVAAAARATGAELSAVEVVGLLARRKAEAALPLLVGDLAPAAGETVLVFGGDSAFEFAGVVYGKPHHPQTALERWRAYRGRTGVLHSGHWLVSVRDGVVLGAVGETTAASVSFVADLDDAELEAYVADGEPLEVAGAFKIDAKGGAFVERIDGDPTTVIGLSVPALRRLVRRLGVAWPDLWNLSASS